MCVCTHMLSSVRLLCDPMASLSVEFSGKNSVTVCYFLLQGFFPAQGLNLSLLHLP